MQLLCSAKRDHARDCINSVIKYLAQCRQFIRNMNANINKPVCHIQIAGPSPIFEALFIEVLSVVLASVAVLVVTPGADTITLIIWTVLTIVTGPEGLSVTMVFREVEVIVSAVGV